MCHVQLTANPKMSSLHVTGASVLPTAVVEQAFRQQYGRTINVNQVKKAMDSINDWYKDQGYFGQACC